MKKVLISVIIGLSVVFATIVVANKYIHIKQPKETTVINNKSLMVNIKNKEDILNDQRDKINNLEKEKKTNISDIKEIKKETKKIENDANSESLAQKDKVKKVVLNNALENMQDSMFKIMDVVIPLASVIGIFFLLRRLFEL
jgi:TolA-binding protein